MIISIIMLRCMYYKRRLSKFYY